MKSKDNLVVLGQRRWRLNRYEIGVDLHMFVHEQRVIRSRKWRQRNRWKPRTVSTQLNEFMKRMSESYKRHTPSIFETYSIRLVCDNCGHVSYTEVPKGMEVSASGRCVCFNCGTKNARKA